MWEFTAPGGFVLFYVFGHMSKNVHIKKYIAFLFVKVTENEYIAQRANPFSQHIHQVSELVINYLKIQETKILRDLSFHQH